MTAEGERKMSIKLKRLHKAKIWARSSRAPCVRGGACRERCGNTQYGFLPFDEGMCPPCLEYFGERNPEKCPALDEYEKPSSATWSEYGLILEIRRAESSSTGFRYF